jgi:23S rRNA pseudouridine2605 synthase
MVMNKPVGYVTTARDPEGRPTVLDLAGPTGARLYPVGRLDMDSEGLLFLMNDGRLAFRLTHPKYDVPKTYRTWTSAPPSPRPSDCCERASSSMMARPDRRR